MGVPQSCGNREAFCDLEVVIDEYSGFNPMISVGLLAWNSTAFIGGFLHFRAGNVSCRLYACNGVMVVILNVVYRSTQFEVTHRHREFPCRQWCWVCEDATVLPV